MSRYKAYAEYKVAGQNYEVLIPELWSLSKVKYIGDYMNGFPFKPTQWAIDGTPIIRIQNLSNQSAEINRTDFVPPERYQVKRGDILISWSATLDVYIWNGEDAWLNQHIFRVSINDHLIFKGYFYWTAKWFMGELNEASHGSTMQHLTADKFGGFEVPLPPMQEQWVIANFLDHETAKIDTLIAKQQGLIKLLKEKRQAVISHAVTKGLNLNALMRDSGVEWLGEVPAHWEVKRIGSLFSESNSRANSAEELRYPILSVSIHHGISDKELNEEELDRKVTRSDDKSLYKIVHQNDLAYNMMRAWQGGFGASTLSGLVSPAYVVCKPKTALNSFYFELALRTSSAVTELKRYSRGITDFRLRLYWDEFKCIEVPVPLKTEVDEILSAILKINTTYDNLVIVAEDQIKLLLERRTALISAAVTGKIDVRDWQPAIDATKELVL